MLYHHLEELGADIKELRKRKALFEELERLYFDLLNKKLTDRHKHVHKMPHS